MTPTLARPQYEADPGDPQRVKLAGDWTLASALAFDLAEVPGATPKKPASGLMAYSRPSAPGRIQQMSSPMVQTFQPALR